MVLSLRPRCWFKNGLVKIAELYFYYIFCWSRLDKIVVVETRDWDGDNELERAGTMDTASGFWTGIAEQQQACEFAWSGVNWAARLQNNTKLRDNIGLQDSLYHGIIQGVSGNGQCRQWSIARTDRGSIKQHRNKIVRIVGQSKAIRLGT